MTAGPGHGPLVLLRDCLAGDVDTLEEHWIPEVQRWLSGGTGPSFRRVAQQYVDDAIASARALPRERFELVAEVDGRFVGTARVAVRDLANASGEIGYALRQDERGRGYGTAVARQLLDIGFRRLGLHRVWATVHPDNAAAIRVLEKVGMRTEGRLREDLRVPGGWRDSLLYAVLETDPRR